jgi:hypothetical protein
MFLRNHKEENYERKGVYIKERDYANFTIVVSTQTLPHMIKDGYSESEE